MTLIEQLKSILATNQNGHLDLNECVVLGQAIEQIEDDLRFRQEWVERFGFLATKNTKASFASIDEVATIIYKQRQKAFNCAEEAAQKAYENADEVCAKRVPWSDLSDPWKDYWRGIVKTVVATIN